MNIPTSIQSTRMGLTSIFVLRRAIGLAAIAALVACGSDPNAPLTESDSVAASGGPSGEAPSPTSPATDATDVDAPTGGQAGATDDADPETGDSAQAGPSRGAPVSGQAGEVIGGAVTGGSAFVTPSNVRCTPVTNGIGAVSVNGGAPRSYYVDLPNDLSGPTALMFSWHGFGQDPLDFKNALRFDPNGGSKPIIVVTPTDTGLFLQSGGLDWFIKGVRKNVDFPYFQGMLSCLEQQFDVDDTRLYSFGFSAGAVFTNLLSSQWPHLFAATVSESGAWFNDIAQRAATDGVGLLYPWDWPRLDPNDGGEVLMTHGGITDYATIISIELAAKAAVPFLKKAKRTVVDCAHNSGHTIDPNVTKAMIYEYLLAHKLGEPSPFANGAGLFQDFPSSCTLRRP